MEAYYPLIPIRNAPSRCWGTDVSINLNIFVDLWKFFSSAENQGRGDD